ncbi:MAG: right-handed parallel beta-helix repeat-containing protein [Clostridia bacterium]|nr:right-handed parallel beta-helix repeat-containing protein [Clostridia bacterium]
MATYLITDYGAVSGGALCTKAIQQAIDACFLAGGGVVEVPAGDFHTGGLRLRSRVTLHLAAGARLCGSRDPEDYTGYIEDAVEPLEADIARLAKAVEEGDPYIFNYACSRWRNGLIRAIHAEDIAIIGEKGAVIDGRNCYDPQGEEGFRGPHAISLHDCARVTLQGYTVQHSANWAHAIFDSRDLTVEGIAVYGGHDGVHLRSCDGVTVRDCRFYTGDDCVAGFDNRDVTVAGCELNTACSGFRFGGTHVRIRDCHLFGPARYLHRFSLTEEEKVQETAMAEGEGHRYNMLSAFTYFADNTRPVREQPGDIRLECCVIENTDRLLHYNFSGNETYQQNRPLEDIVFNCVRASGIRLPLTLYGQEDVPVVCQIQQSTISMEPGVPFMQAAYFKRIELQDTAIHHDPAQPLIRIWTEGDILCEGEVAVERTSEPFFATPI